MLGFVLFRGGWDLHCLWQADWLLWRAGLGADWISLPRPQHLQFNVYGAFGCRWSSAGVVALFSFDREPPFSLLASSPLPIILSPTRVIIHQWFLPVTVTTVYLLNGDFLFLSLLPYLLIGILLWEFSPIYLFLILFIYISMDLDISCIQPIGQP